MMQPLKSLVFLKTSRSIFSQTARLRELAIWSVQKKLRLEHLLRYLRALPTIRVHPELDGRSLGIVHSLIIGLAIMVYKPIYHNLQIW